MLFLMLSAFLSPAGLESCYVIPMDFWLDNSHGAPGVASGAEEILKLMDVVVTGDEVNRGKPQRLGTMGVQLVPRELRDVMGKPARVGLVVLLFAIGFLEYVPRNQESISCSYIQSH